MANRLWLKRGGEGKYLAYGQQSALRQRPLQGGAAEMQPGVYDLTHKITVRHSARVIRPILPFATP